MYFGRQNALKMHNRNFKELEEMSDVLIQNWNDKVSDSDTVYHLGNFAWDPFSANIALQQLNGNILFLEGNRDKALDETIKFHDKIDLLEDRILELPEHNLLLCYYPLEHWNGKDEGVLHCHGYSHLLFPHQVENNRMNVSVDCWNLSPINLDTIMDLIKEFKSYTNE